MASSPKSPRKRRKEKSCQRKSGRQFYSAHQVDALNLPSRKPLIRRPLPATSQWLLGTVVSIADRLCRPHQNYISQKSMRGRPVFWNLGFGVIDHHYFQANLKLGFIFFQVWVYDLCLCRACFMCNGFSGLQRLLTFLQSRESKRQGTENAPDAKCSLSACALLAITHA